MILLKQKGDLSIWWFTRHTSEFLRKKKKKLSGCLCFTHQYMNRIMKKLSGQLSPSGADAGTGSSRQ